MSSVYIVRKIEDYEYGHRNIEAVFSEYEDAKKYIDNAGNHEVAFWDRRKIMLYTIERYTVK